MEDERRLPDLVEIAPGLYRVRKPEPAPARSDLPAPHVISDEMPPTEQVDGAFYTSKRKFRAVGRQLGLTEVGSEKFKPKRRASEDRNVIEGRKRDLQVAVEQHRAGHRPSR